MREIQLPITIYLSAHFAFMEDADLPHTTLTLEDLNPPSKVEGAKNQAAFAVSL